MAIRASWILLLLSSVCAVSAARREVLVEWSVDGVQEYSDSPLEVNLGDTLFFECVPGSFSNVFFMVDMNQFTNCNGTDEDGKYLPEESRVGFCDEAANGMRENLTTPITQHSDDIGEIQYSADMDFYFASFSNGSGFMDAISKTTVDGQCLNGLRLTIHVNPAPQPTTTEAPGGTGSSGGLTGPLTELQVITVAVVCSVVGIVILVVCIVICLVCFKCCCYAKKKSVSFENGIHNPMTDGPEIKDNNNVTAVRTKGPSKSNKINVSQNKPKLSDKNGKSPAENDVDPLKSGNKPTKPTDNRPAQRRTAPAKPDDNELNEQNRRMPGSNRTRNGSAKHAPAEKKPSAGRKPAEIKKTAVSKPGNKSTTTKLLSTATEPADKKTAVSKSHGNKSTTTKALSSSSTAAKNTPTGNKNATSSKPPPGKKSLSAKPSRPLTAGDKPDTGSNSKQQVNRTSSGGVRRPAPSKHTAANLSNGSQHSALSRRGTLPNPEGTGSSTQPETSSLPVGVQTRGVKNRGNVSLEVEPDRVRFSKT